MILSTTVLNHLTVNLKTNLFGLEAIDIQILLVHRKCVKVWFDICFIDCIHLCYCIKYRSHMQGSLFIV